MKKRDIKSLRKTTTKEWISYVEALHENSNEESMSDNREVNLVELKVGPRYICKFLQKGEVDNKMAKRVYKFDVSKSY